MLVDKAANLLKTVQIVVRDRRVVGIVVTVNYVKFGKSIDFVDLVEVDSIHSKADAEIAVVEDSVILVFVDRPQYTTLSIEKDEKEDTNGSDNYQLKSKM